MQKGGVAVKGMESMVLDVWRSSRKNNTRRDGSEVLWGVARDCLLRHVPPKNLTTPLLSFSLLLNKGHCRWYVLGKMSLVRVYLSFYEQGICRCNRPYLSRSRQSLGLDHRNKKSWEPSASYLHESRRDHNCFLIIRERILKIRQFETRQVTSCVCVWTYRRW